MIACIRFAQGDVKGLMCGMYFLTFAGSEFFTGIRRLFTLGSMSSHTLRLFVFFFSLITTVCSFSAERATNHSAGADGIDRRQIPDWSAGDLDFFLHGSMSTEVVPETVLRAFMAAYPDLFPDRDFTSVGLIRDPAFGWPIGFSRSRVPHLGGLSSVGINCASCHVGEIRSGDKSVRVLGVTSHFDAEGFFRVLLGSTFLSADPANMKKVVAAYFEANEPKASDEMGATLASRWKTQEQNIAMAMKEVSGSNKPGVLHKISSDELKLDAQNVGTVDLAALSGSMLKLFHNMRAALHVPDEPPKQSLPASGPGRNDAFGLLSAVLFGEPQPYAPVKYGLVWDVDKRDWVHWDGNTRSPLGRNMLAALGLGAPLVGKQAKLDFALVKRQTGLSERIRAPRYPFAIDQGLARRGAAHYQARCASCHDGPEGPGRLHDPAEIGTEPTRVTIFTQRQADNFNDFLAGIETEGYHAAKEPGIRSTRKIWAASLPGVWARSPYLHNGSVRTMSELLSGPAQRAKSFHRGSREFLESDMGYSDSGSYVLDTALAGNSNAGHDYGADLDAAQKRELIEFLKTL